MAGLGKIDSTVLSETYQETISSIVSDNFKEFGKILPLVTDVSNLVGKGDCSIEFPCRDGFDHEALATPLAPVGPLGGPDPVSCQQLVFTTDKLDLDKRCAVAVSYDRKQNFKSKVDVVAEIAKEALATLLSGIEESLLTDIATVDPVNDLDVETSGTLTEGDLLCAVEALHKKNIPMSDRFWLVNPSDWKRIFQLDCFTKANLIGDQGRALREGTLGSVYGSPVIWDNRVPADEIYYFHRDHVRYARHGEVEILRSEKPKELCIEESWNVLFGHKTIKGGCRGARLDITPV